MANHKLFEKDFTTDSIYRDDPDTGGPSDDEFIDVASTTRTPILSRNVTRPTSPSPGGGRRAFVSSPLRNSRSTAAPHEVLMRKLARINASTSSRDPLRIIPDRARTLVFCYLEPQDLAACSLVSTRWKKSQTMNHAWYRLYRQETYHGSDLPVGKWTKRESKKDWRTEYLQYRRNRLEEESAAPLFTYLKAQSQSHTPNGRISGYQTPKEINEERWKQEETISLTKNEMRDKYKELGGRKPRTKTKAGMTGGMRDRTAYTDGGDEW